MPHTNSAYMILCTCLTSFFLAWPARAEDEPRMLFQFDSPEASRQWQTVNDGVMGGRSEGRFKINDDQRMEFFGTLSLENNGGFASVRSRSRNLELKPGDTLILSVRGDGRKYTMNLYPPTRRIAFSYGADFETVKDEWVEVSLPVDAFEATSFGRVDRDAKLDPTEIQGVGILLGDKKAGPFALEVAWIKVRSSE